MFNLRNVSAACMIAVLGLTGCQNNMSNSNTQNPSSGMPGVKDHIAKADLSNFDWQLLNAVNSQSQTIPTLADIKNDVKLDFAQDNAVSFTVGCNSMSGSYRLNNNTLQVGNVRTTMMMCQEKDAAEKLLNATMQGNSQLTYNTGGMPILKQTASNGVSLMWQGTPTPQAQYNQEGETVFFKVSHTTAPCSSDASKTCLLVKPLQYDNGGLKMSEGQWQLFEGDIRGYTHDSTLNQIIRVKRYVTNDNSSRENVYIFDSVVETSKAD